MKQQKERIKFNYNTSLRGYPLLTGCAPQYWSLDTPPYCNIVYKSFISGETMFTTIRNEEYSKGPHNLELHLLKLFFGEGKGEWPDIFRALKSSQPLEEADESHNLWRTEICTAGVGQRGVEGGRGLGRGLGGLRRVGGSWSTQKWPRLTDRSSPWSHADRNSDYGPMAHIRHNWRGTICPDRHSSDCTVLCVSATVTTCGATGVGHVTYGC